MLPANLKTKWTFDSLVESRELQGPILGPMWTRQAANMRKEAVRGLEKCYVTSDNEDRRNSQQDLER